MEGSYKDSSDFKLFQMRRIPEEPRPGEWRSCYSRDRARIIHSSSFRRLQGKTQVMGAGENDFHRTRLTHSLEVAQIGLGLFEGLQKRKLLPPELFVYTKSSRPILSSACYAHDLGHPPYGHGGEIALHEQMKGHGGFEGNGHTVRLLVKLEKYKRNFGINPTRRVVLSVLKYPVSFDDYSSIQRNDTKPPKCYFSTEKDAISWALEPFIESDRAEFVKTALDKNGKMKPCYKSFDASIMECGDDIAYCTHDLEDIVARNLVGKDELMGCVKKYYGERGRIGSNSHGIEIDDFLKLFNGSYERKQTIGKIVNFFMVNTKLRVLEDFEHPLLKYNLIISEEFSGFAEFLKKELTYGLVVRSPEVQMLERKGQRLIKMLFEEFMLNPETLIPHWNEMDNNDSIERRVCDYIAGMTDSFSTKIYHRLFSPGIGTSRDEL